jgi:diguanylate cyclase (GGDEF)-like protein/PAS domain S-box-containing protein
MTSSTPNAPGHAPDYLFQAAPAGMAELASDGTIRHANPALATLTGAASPDALTGTGLKALIPDNQRERLEAAMATAEAGDIARLRISTPDQRLPDLDVSLSPIAADCGETAGFVLVAQSAHGPAEAEEHYEEMFRRNPAPKLLIDPDTGYIADANPAALDFYGYSLDGIRQIRIQDINLLSEAEVRAEWERARREERRYFEFRHRLAGGEIRDVKVYSGPMRVAGREYLHSIIHDVTEARRYQEHLEQYKVLFDRLPVGIYRNYAGDEGQFAEVNPAMARIFGASQPQDLIGFPVARLYRDPEQRRRFSDELERNGAVFHRELALQTLDGRPIWGAITAQAHQTATGHTVFDGVIEDITERKKAESALRESERRYRTIITTMAEGVALHGSDGSIVATNPAAERILGLSEDQILGRAPTDPGWHAIREDGTPFPGQDHPASLVLSTGEPVHDQVMGIQDPQRGLRWISINAEPLVTDEGIEGAVATFADITEQLAAERALADREAQYRDLVENQTQFVERYLPDTTVTFANQALADLLGTDPQSLVGQAWMELLPETERAAAWAHLASFTPEAPVGHFENSVILPSGEQRWVRWTNRAFFDETGNLTHFQSVGIDITERREAEHARDRLVEILEATPDFVSIARPDGSVLYVNAGGRRLVGMPDSPTGLGDHLPQSIQEETAGDWAHPDWASRLLREEAIPTAIAEGYWEGETALLDVNNREIPVSQVIIAHRNDAGELTRLSTIMRDISRHKELEDTLEKRQEALQRLQDITGDPNRELDPKLQDLLALGAHYFGLDYGIVSHIQDEDYQIRQAISPDGSLAPGQHFDLGVTYCTQTLAANGPTGFYHVADSEIRNHPCYRIQGMEAYLGVPIRTGNEVYGTLNFSRPEPREPFSEFEWELLKLMGQWISYELTREANRKALERERSLFIGGPTVVFVWDNKPGWPVTYVSPNLEADFGHAPEAVIGSAFSDLIHPDDRERTRLEVADFLEREAESFEQEYRLRAGDGSYRWVYDFAVPIRNDGGAVESVQGYLLDITERRALETEQRLLATAFHTSQALMITDARGTIERVNPAFTEITGYTAEEAIGQDPSLIASGVHDTGFYAAMWQALTANGHWEGEIWNRRKDGEIYPQWESISAVRNQAGELEHYVAVFHDISEQKRLEAELERLATHDPLTGIFNRAKLYEVIEAAEKEFTRYGIPFALIMFDLDHFKAVNDRYGHAAGDAVLKELARRVAAQLRDTDRFGRWGGEEFLIVAGHTDRDGACRLAERIRRAVADNPFSEVGPVTVSMGVAEIAPGEASEELEERADSSLYRAKTNGRNRVETG